MQLTMIFTAVALQRTGQPSSPCPSCPACPDSCQGLLATAAGRTATPSSVSSPQRTRVYPFTCSPLPDSTSETVSMDTVVFPSYFITGWVGGLLDVQCMCGRAAVGSDGQCGRGSPQLCVPAAKYCQTVIAPHLAYPTAAAGRRTSCFTFLAAPRH